VSPVEKQMRTGALPLGENCRRRQGAWSATHRSVAGHASSSRNPRRPASLLPSSSPPPLLSSCPPPLLRASAPPLLPSSPPPGIIFTICATATYPIVVTRIKCARHPWAAAGNQSMTVLVSPPAEDMGGGEVVRDLATWTLAGDSGSMPEAYTPCLPCVSVFDDHPQYGDMPLKHPFVVPPGTQRAVALHSDAPLLIRRELRLPVGEQDSPPLLAPGLATKVGVMLGARLKAKPRAVPVSFVGEIVYRRCPPV